MVACRPNLTMFVLDDLDYAASHSILSRGESCPDPRRGTLAIRCGCPNLPFVVERAVRAAMSRFSGRTAVTLRG